MYSGAWLGHVTAPETTSCGVVALLRDILIGKMPTLLPAKMFIALIAMVESRD
jgi:hypothetical protein